MIVLDIEYYQSDTVMITTTDKQVKKKEIVLCGIYDGKQYYHFKQLEEAIIFLLENYELPITVLSHAGCIAEHLAIIEALKNREIKYIPKKSKIKRYASALIKVNEEDIINGKLNTFCLYRKKKNKSVLIRFKDTFSILRDSLEELGENFGFPKMKFDFEKITKNMNEDEYKKLIEYNRNDCEILYKIVEKFIAILTDNITHNENESRKLFFQSPTIANMTLKIFKKYFHFKGKKEKFPLFNVKIFDEIEEKDKYFRQYYYGGRTEVFLRYYSGKGFCYDVNSLYPFIMANNVFSCNPLECDREIWIRLKNNPNYNYFIEADVKHIKDLPLLPVKTDEGKLIFPTGEFTTLITKKEWEYIEKHKNYQILKVRRYWISSAFPYFKDFVETLYKLRQSAKQNKNASLSHVCKLLMNSLYGKFGQKPERDNKSLFSLTDDNPNWDKELIIPIPNTNYAIVNSHSVNYTDYIKVWISLEITAYARLHLYQLIQSIGEDHVFYCDTDSIFTDIELTCSNEIGKLKKEYEFSEAYFLSPKCYCVITDDDIIAKVKGIPSFLVKSNDIRKIIRELLEHKIDNYTFNFTRITGLFTGIRRGFFFSDEEVERSITAEYDKRILEDNIRTKPIEIRRVK